MTKQVIDFNRLPKQEYMKPVMEVIELQHKSQILAGSVTSVSTNLGDGPTLPGGEEPKSGDVWEDTW